MPQTDGEWRIISAIPPLLKTKWGQGGAYKPNSYGRFCPNKVAGCVIVAAAQIIAYYQAESTFHPKGEHRGHYNQPIHLDWERIMADCQNNHGGLDPATTPKSMEEVADLCHYLGRLFNANYKFGEHPSRNSTAAKGDDPIKWFRRNGAGLRATRYKKYNEGDVIRGIKEGNPVYGTGSAFAQKKFLHTKHHGNHAWVYDGYIRASNTSKEHDLLHCNWGWDGYQNGYYLGRFFDTNNGPKIHDEVLTRGQSHNYRYNFQYSIIMR